MPGILKYYLFFVLKNSWVSEYYSLYLRRGSAVKKEHFTLFHSLRIERFILKTNFPLTAATRLEPVSVSTKIISKVMGIVACSLVAFLIIFFSKMAARRLRFPFLYIYTWVITSLDKNNITNYCNSCKCHFGLVFIIIIFPWRRPLNVQLFKLCQKEILSFTGGFIM